MMIRLLLTILHQGVGSRIGISHLELSEFVFHIDDASTNSLID